MSRKICSCGIGPAGVHRHDMSEKEWLKKNPPPPDYKARCARYEKALNRVKDSEHNKDCPWFDDVSGLIPAGGRECSCPRSIATEALEGDTE